MKRSAPITKEWLECDGCEYSIDKARPTLVTIPLEPGVQLEFHFHSPEGGVGDCFRTWSHAPSIMTRSLKERGLDEDAIDAFLATHLYRKQPWQAGLQRPSRDVA